MSPLTFICPNDKETRIYFANCEVVKQPENDLWIVSYLCPKCRQQLTYNINNASSMSRPTILENRLEQPKWTRQGGN